jgi:predicted phosphoribosyltransferase
MSMSYSRFKSREDAAKKLARELLKYWNKNSVVLAIPRGGVVIGYEVAKILNAHLDLIIPRKIGAPNNPELAIGAVTEDGNALLNQQLIDELGISKEFIESEKKRQIQEIKRRIIVYRGDTAASKLEGKTVILVDDGIATGSTMKAAINSIQKKKPLSIVVASPVGPPDTVEELKKEVDELICLIVYEPFFALGQFYDNFNQVTDEEVIALLKLLNDAKS